MSLLDDRSIEISAVYDCVTDVARSQRYFVDKAGLYTTYQPVVTTNWSNSQITFNVNTNNTSTIISPYVIVAVPMTATFTGTAGGGNLLPVPFDGTVALRSFPLNQCISSASLQLNTATMTSQPNLYTSALQHHNLYNSQIDFDLSGFPSLPDNDNQYLTGYGSSTNPLNPFSSSDYWQNGRGSFPVTVTANTSSSATVTWTCYEPILLSPLSITPDEGKGFVGITQFNLQLQLSTLSRMWSYNVTNGNGVTAISTTIAGNPTLFIKNVSPDTIMYKIPNEIKYRYENVQVFQTTNATPVTSGSAFTITSNSITLQQIPSKIFIYARRQEADLQTAAGFQYSDGFSTIQGINCLFNNVQGLLSSASGFDLFRLSRRNGMQIDWPAWSGRGAVATGGTRSTLGSILAIDVAKDFGLPSDLAAGVFGEQYNFSAIVNMMNPATTTITYTLFVVFIFDGVLTLSPGSAFQQLGVLSRSDVLNAPRLDQKPSQSKGNIFVDAQGEFADGNDISGGALAGALAGAKLTKSKLAKRR